MSTRVRRCQSVMCGSRAPKETGARHGVDAQLFKSVGSGGAVAELFRELLWELFRELFAVLFAELSGYIKDININKYK